MENIDSVDKNTPIVVLYRRNITTHTGWKKIIVDCGSIGFSPVGLGYGSPLLASYYGADRV